MSDTVPTGDTMEVVLDRMKRAGNFAGNCAFIGENGGITPEQIRVYISSARRMLDDAEAALDAVETAARASEPCRCVTTRDEDSMSINFTDCPRHHGRKVSMNGLLGKP